MVLGESLIAETKSSKLSRELAIPRGKVLKSVLAQYHTLQRSVKNTEAGRHCRQCIAIKLYQQRSLAAANVLVASEEADHGEQLIPRYQVNNHPGQQDARKSD